jgi:hypothetical protein
LFFVEGDCTNGYHCCRTHCDRCRSCSTSCGRRQLGDGSIGPAEEETRDMPIVKNMEVGGVDMEKPTGNVWKSENNKKIVRALLSKRITVNEAARQQRRILKKSCHTSCHYYDCNCYCISSVSQRLCTYTCLPYYEAHIEVSFPWHIGGIVPNATLDKQVTTTVIKDFKEDETAAHRYLALHFPKSKSQNGTRSSRIVTTSIGSQQSEPCFYDPLWPGPNDPNNRYHTLVETDDLAFTWDLGYTPGWWVLFGVPAFSVLMMLMKLSHHVLEYITNGGRLSRSISFQGCHVFDQQVWCLSISLWFGILFPFSFFLPLELFGKIDSTGKIILHYLTYIFIGIGNLPILLELTFYRFSKLLTTVGINVRTKVQTHSTITVVLGWLVPMCVLYPSSFWVGSTNDNNTVHWILPSAMIVIFFLIYPYIAYSFFFIKTPPQQNAYKNITAGLQQQPVQQQYQPLLKPGNQGGVTSAATYNVDADSSSQWMNKATPIQQQIGLNNTEETKFFNDTTATLPLPETVPPRAMPSAPPMFDATQVIVPLSARPLLPHQLIQNLWSCQSTPDLLSLMEKLRLCNISGELSAAERSDLIQNVKQRRAYDTVFANDIWTKEVSIAYGKLLRS